MFWSEFGRERFCDRVNRMGYLSCTLLRGAQDYVESSVDRNGKDTVDLVDADVR